MLTLGCAVAVVVAASAPPSCSKTSSTSLLVEWDAVEATDLYYVALSESATDRPFALRCVCRVHHLISSTLHNTPVSPLPFASAHAHLERTPTRHSRLSPMSAIARQSHIHTRTNLQVHVYIHAHTHTHTHTPQRHASSHMYENTRDRN